MKILFLAPASSIHTVRWVNALAQKNEVYLVSLLNHKMIDDEIDLKVKINYLPISGGKGYYLNGNALKKLARQLNADIVNVHYASGYGTLARIAHLPNIILSVWGSDVYDFPYRNRINMYIIKKNLLYAKHIVSTSEAMKIQVLNILDKKIEGLKGTVPTLLLHSCCGPCSTYVLEYLSKYFKITVVYYNPNIFPQEEYEHRLREQKKVVENMPFENPVDLIFEDYEHSDFIKNIKGLENEPEGGARCTECFRFRLEKTAELAKERKYDYFTTTLSVSPHKNSQLLNELGKEIGEKYGVEYLFGDFKKREGYKRSIIVSKEYDLYRQEYCGCEFSLRKED